MQSRITAEGIAKLYERISPECPDIAKYCTPQHFENRFLIHFRCKLGDKVKNITNRDLMEFSSSILVECSVFRLACNNDEFIVSVGPDGLFRIKDGGFADSVKRLK